MRKSVLLSGLTYMYGLCGYPQTAISQEMSYGQPNLYCEHTPQAKSLGEPTRGSLINGIPMNSDECLESKTKDNFASEEMANLLSDVSCHMKYLTGARLSIQDISGPRGGRLKPHKSHQNGQDVDVGHFRINKHGYENSTGYVTTNQESLAVTWEFIRYIVNHPVAVEYIFWSPSNIHKLHNYVKSSWGEQEWEEYSTVFHPERRHKKHMHIRIKKPAQSKPNAVALTPRFLDVKTNQL